MASLQEFIEHKENAFRKFDTPINPGEQSVQFGTIINDVPQETGWLYLWVVEKKGQPLVIIYVGQTNLPILERMMAHTRGSMLNRLGIIGNPRGYSNANYIRGLLRSNSEYEIRVYYRLSKPMNVLNHIERICQAEEIALIRTIHTSGNYSFLLESRATALTAEDPHINEWVAEIQNLIPSTYIMTDYAFEN